MLKSQEIQLAQSKRREKMASIQKADEINDDGRTELRGLTEAYEGAEVELRAALLVEGAERDKIKAPDKAETDFGRECRAFNLANAVEAMTEGRAISGREAEVSAELENRDGKARQGIRFPTEALLERRADAIVTAPDASSGDLASRPTMQALERLFEQSAAQAFGFRAIQVTGQPRFPELTSGASASWVAEGSGVDAAAITTAVSEPSIHTLTARYLLSRQAIRQNSVLEPMLRRDLSEVIREGMDKAVFQGSGAGNEPAGLASLLTGTSFADANVAYAAIVEWAVDLMVSAKLASMAGIYVAGVPGHLKSLLTTPFSDKLTEYEQAQKIVPNLVFANNVSAVASGTPDTASMYVSAPTQHAYMVQWGSPEMIIDPYTESKTGKVAITVFNFVDILVQRQATHWLKIDDVSVS
jgi:HK97 family phage major capsid protein